jgi:hypothetical protein
MEKLAKQGRMNRRPWEKSLAKRLYEHSSSFSATRMEDIFPAAFRTLWNTACGEDGGKSVLTLPRRNFHPRSGSADEEAAGRGKKLQDFSDKELKIWSTSGGNPHPNSSFDSKDAIRPTSMCFAAFRPRFLSSCAACGGVFRKAILPLWISSFRGGRK